MRRELRLWTLGTALCLGALLSPAPAAETIKADVATSPTSAPAASMEALVQKVRADEAWIWRASSFLARFQGQWKKSPEAVRLRLGELEKKYPGMNFNDPATQAIFLGLPPSGVERMLLAWDAKRLAWFDDKDKVSSDHRVFDGKQARLHEQHLDTGQEQYSLDNTWRKISANALTNFGIGRVSYPDVWWDPLDKSARAYVEPPISAYQDQGIANRDGQRYRLIVNHVGPARTELWINLATGRLQYLKTWSFPQIQWTEFEQVNSVRSRALMTALAESLLSDKASESAAAALRAKMEKDPDWLKTTVKKFDIERMQEIMKGNQPDYSTASAAAWLRILRDEGLLGQAFPAIQQAVDKKLKARPALVAEAEDRAMATVKRETGFEAIPQQESALEDWRQAAPGKFFPFRQTLVFYMKEPANAGVVDMTSSMTAVEVSLDKPLAADLFAMPIKEGSPVYDWGRVPPLSYRFKEKFTTEEWDKILKDAADLEKKKQEITSQRMSLVGKPAPEIKAQRWLNGEPVDLPRLRGKWTLIHFFAEWSPPSLSEIGQLVDWRNKNAGDQVVVLGIHSPGTDEAKIQNVIKDKAIPYPVAIDKEIHQGASLGETFAAYRVIALPRAVLIDPQGAVAAEGTLDQVLTAADQKLKKN